ncbi:hypothetical protein Acel_0456 [Acidothermus cellulolyticus 11B]|uniref:Uncharacterized protein n=1 Tax=Acidothermus cellulolyticus (strain ATCC 43068 / DSM 8971 / 11B) TaxID=351607 RepID=A0LS20_ACIC1|nr:hypothetical protein Acel_0456 [Acidothermus cellulolyticus 11B]
MPASVLDVCHRHDARRTAGRPPPRLGDRPAVVEAGRPAGWQTSRPDRGDCLIDGKARARLLDRLLRRVAGPNTMIRLDEPVMTRV